MSDPRTIEQRLDAIETILRLQNETVVDEEQAANILQVHPATLAGWRSQGKIDFVALGGGDKKAGCIRYTKQQLDSFLRRHTHRARQGRE